jgi:glycosyltransferase involved in cell wall biosynthesis
MKIIVVIPCRNEEKHIGATVKALVDKGYHVMVSDDGSTDQTVAQAYNAGAEIVGCADGAKHGYGATLRRGVSAAQVVYDPDILVFMDGDGQHDPNDIHQLLGPILYGKADVVLGSRLGVQDHRPLYRRLSNKFGTWLANIGAKQKVTDAITGYWALRAIRLGIMTEDGWGASFENLIKLRAAGCHFMSVPVQAIWHDDPKENSTSNALMLGLIVVWKIIKWRVICDVFHKGVIVRDPLRIELLMEQAEDALSQIDQKIKEKK